MIQLNGISDPIKRNRHVFDQQAGCHAVSHIEPRSDWTGKNHAERSIILLQIPLLTRSEIEVKYEITEELFSIVDTDERRSMIFDLCVLMIDTDPIETKYKPKSSLVGSCYGTLKSLPCTLDEIQINYDWWKCVIDIGQFNKICEFQANRILDIGDEKCHLAPKMKREKSHEKMDSEIDDRMNKTENLNSDTNTIKIVSDSN